MLHPANYINIRDKEYYDYQKDNIYHSTLMHIFNKYSNSNQQVIAELELRDLILIPEFMYDSLSIKYIMRISNTNPFPKMMIKPLENDSFKFIYPSFVCWKDDDSYIIPFYPTEEMEIPKNALKSTYGYYKEDRAEVRYYNYKI